MNRETPRRWTLVTLLVLALLIASVAGATAQEAAPGSGAPKSGTLEVVHFDDFESGRSMDTYWLVDESGQRTELQFPDGAPAGLLTGRRISVAGEIADGVLQVGELSGEAAPAAVVTGEQRTLVLTVNFQDRALSCSNTQVDGIMFTGTRNTDGYYRETSYNNIWFTGLVSGPYTINYSTTSPCDYYGWANAAEAAAQAAGINVSLYNRRVYVMPSAGSCGTWAGLGTLGGNPSRSWIASCGTVDVYPHELGHNLTMHHSSTDPNNDGIVDVEYGDTSDIMGYAGVGWRQLNAPHKEEMGWLPPAKYRTVTAGGTYSIAPTELDPAATTLPQALKIARSGGGNYYISYRVPIGYDAGMPSAYSNKTNIHHWSGASGAKTMFLATLTDGGVWSETSGSLSVKQVSRSADAVTVEISFQCVPAAPSVTVAPASQGGAAGATLSYNVSVKNNDVSSCPDTIFNLAGTAPIGWTAGVGARGADAEPRPDRLSHPGGDLAGGHARRIVRGGRERVGRRAADPQRRRQRDLRGGRRAAHRADQPEGVGEAQVDHPDLVSLQRQRRRDRLPGLPQRRAADHGHRPQLQGQHGDARHGLHLPRQSPRCGRQRVGAEQFGDGDGPLGGGVAADAGVRQSVALCRTPLLVRSGGAAAHLVAVGAGPGAAHRPGRRGDRLPGRAGACGAGAGRSGCRAAVFRGGRRPRTAGRCPERPGLGRAAPGRIGRGTGVSAAGADTIRVGEERGAQAWAAIAARLPLEGTHHRGATTPGTLP